MPSILRRYRIAALLGAAFIAAPLAMPIFLHNTPAYAQAGLSAVPGPVTSGGSFAGIVAADKPAVVTITTEMKTQKQATDDTTPFEEQFRQFFGEQGIPLPQQQPKQQPSQQTEALGSGFIISPDGYIVTNNHVIDNATSIKVTLDDGTELPATLVGADAKSDLAVVKITSPKPLPVISWGDSDRLKTGDQILAIGNPFGIGTTVTAGIVSARGRDLHSGPYDDFIQIDAPINHGNSGGPLVDVEGQVVGINTAIYSPNGGSVGVGFAIPSDQAQKVVVRLMKDGSIRHGFIGVQIQPVTPDVANAIGLATAEGALVAKVETDTPAGRAGIKTGDVITALDGQAIKSPRDLSRMVADLSPGQKEHVTVWRQGENRDLLVTVGGNDPQGGQAAADNGGQQGDASSQSLPMIGLGLADITPAIRQALNLPKGETGTVVESIAPSKPAANAGLQVGDVIVSVNQTAVKSASEAKAAISQAGKAGRKSVLFLVQRGDSQTYLAVPFANG
ncbi:DegQ family serine endoprotease [Agrobacterium arsenijevicii]|uniref:Serine protease n=1 Tax=Agrobacterium arsenijevicii TaxID=1585697 RepID=A0ABR5D8G9_9HYPH|nr:serine protease [Agrobacterium arsenijevicii]